jgi:hypothetical protein
MITEFGEGVDFAELELGLDREVKNTLKLWWDGKLEINPFEIWEV